MIEINVAKREKELVANKIAAVIYGPEIKGSINIELDRVAAEKLYNEAGTSGLIKLSVDNASAGEALIRGVAFHPLTGRIRHLEFYQVPAGQKIETEVELEFVGISPAEKELGGVVNKNLSVLPVKCLATDLVQSIQVDLSVLKTFNDFIKIADLKLPNGVEAMLEPDVVVATAVAVKAEAVTPKVEAAVASVPAAKDSKDAVAAK